MGTHSGVEDAYASRTRQAHREGAWQHYDAAMANGFRFALQAAPQDQRQWLAIARRAEELGYATLLMPDGLQLLSPMPALAIAAGATTSLQVGTYVLASPLRAPRLAAWDAHTLSLLSGGRFQLGIGTGRPEVAQQTRRRLGSSGSSAPTPRPSPRMTHWRFCRAAFPLSRVSCSAGETPSAVPTSL